MADLLNTASGYSTDPTRPDYACPAYQEMAPRWTIVEDIREGTARLRAEREKYLPRFEAETLKDWDARLQMTFAGDHYSTTLAEHVGLVLGEPLQLGDDVPPAIKDLIEDIDGEGNHLDVFAHSALDAALHLGHCVLLTDYPQADNIRTRADELTAKARPYVTLYKASDVVSWDFATVGGVRVLVRIILRESASEPDGDFGVKPVTRYREIRQAVYYDEVTGRARGLGAITYRIWKEVRSEAGVKEFEQVGDEGRIVGPDRIAARVVHGGEKLGIMRTKPHLYGLAMSNVEETQVKSDYASVMHKCNVPTPIFIGRNTQQNDGTQSTIQMGQGIDIPGGQGNGAMMLEPSGAALGATRDRLGDIRAQMQRQGATTSEGEGGKVMSATEAAQYAKSRNAKLRRAGRSLQDAIEGVFADMAAFLGLQDGGSVVVDTNFAGIQIDPAYLTVCVNAYDKDALSLEELRYVVNTGKLPDDFDSADVLELLANEAAKQEQKAEDEALAAEAMREQQDMVA